MKLQLEITIEDVPDDIRGAECVAVAAAAIETLRQIAPSAQPRSTWRLLDKPLVEGSTA